jgi:small subunit ribosomal protein S6
MRDYELVLLVHPDVEPQGVTEIVNSITSLITDAGGRVYRLGQLANGSGRIVERPEGDWRKRKLAYPVRKALEGYYLVLQAQISREALAPLERSLRLNEAVMRYLLVRTDE